MACRMSNSEASNDFGCGKKAEFANTGIAKFLAGKVCCMQNVKWLSVGEQEGRTCTRIKPLVGSLMLRNTSQQALARSWSSAAMLGGRLGLIRRGGSFLNEMMGSGILSSLVTVVPKLPFSSSSSSAMSQENSAMPSPRPLPAEVGALEVIP